MARDDLHFRLRIPEALKAEIQAAATANKRSMTAEIIERLQQSFASQHIPPTSDGLSLALQTIAFVIANEKKLRDIGEEVGDPVPWPRPDK